MRCAASTARAGPSQRALPDYRREPQVNPQSNTETFVAMKLEIDSWRWKGVPFYLRVGKAMPRRLSEITVQFRRPPFSLFRNTPIEKLEPNQLVINVQPDEGIQLTFGAKKPGAAMNIGRVAMRFNYADYFGREPATGYERLLYDALLGDQTLFQRADTVEAGWSVVTPVLDVWQRPDRPRLPQLRRRHLGPGRRRRAAGPRGPRVARQQLVNAGASMLRLTRWPLRRRCAPCQRRSLTTRRKRRVEAQPDRDSGSGTGGPVRPGAGQAGSAGSAGRRAALTPTAAQVDRRL